MVEWVTSTQQREEALMDSVLRLLKDRQKPRRLIDAQPDLAARHHLAQEQTRPTSDSTECSINSGSR
jgi:hypothetical protein